MGVSCDYKFSVNDVFDTMVDPDFLAERNIALGDIETECEAEEVDGKVVVRMTRKVEPEMNAWLKKMFSPEQTLHMVETWTKNGSGWSGEYVIEFEGQPITLGATFSLEPCAGGCVYSIQHTASAKIPLVGKKLEKEALSRSEHGVIAELELAARWLEGGPLDA